MARIGRPLVMPAEDRKKEIYSAAEKLFGERGYEQVTMSEIATEVGMSKKTLYVHFGDKRELLRSLVESSYIWPEPEVGGQPPHSVDGLKARLKVIADHALSERHLKLCRLAIAESIGTEGLADTFYQMGIHASRQSLILAIEQIDPAKRAVPFDESILADMLFGATVAKIFVDALLTGARPDMTKVHASIEHVVAGMFRER